MTRKFSPLDLLDMQDRDQDILRCLHREPGLTAAEIAAKIDAQEEEVVSTLKEMMERSQIVEQLENGKRVFSVRFSHQKPRTLHLPTDLLHMLEEGPEIFLAEAPLTSLLTPTEREALLSKSVTRHLMASEVLTWQGDQFQELGLVRMGLLRKTRLQKDQRKQAVGYVRRTEWFGLSEVLSQYSSLDTFTAVTETELLVWPANVFFDFLKENNRLSMAINRQLSQQLHQYQNQLVYGDGRFWAIESVESGAGTTTLAVNMALLVVQNEKKPSRTPLERQR